MKKTFSARAKETLNPTARRLFYLMDEKQTNLSVAADVTTVEELLQLAEAVGPYICVFKTHVDILEDFTLEGMLRLQALAEKHQFLIFEDRKFADIGHTVHRQYAGGVYRIADWSDLTNAHIVPGPGIIQGLKEVGLERGKGLLLLAEMSSSGTMAKGDYTQQAVQWALDNLDFVMGFICTRRLSDHPSLIHMTPGVQLQVGQDNLGQRYLTPEEVIMNRGSDVIIVGRGITEASSPAESAKAYRQAGWEALSRRLTS